MIPMIYLVGIGMTAAAAVVKKYRDSHSSSTMHGVLTPARQGVYEAAMTALEDPAKLSQLAGEFEKNGLPEQADMIRKRAALRALPKEIKKQRKAVFQKAMQSKNKQAVRNLAQAYYNEGATGAAQALHTYADGLPE